MKKQNMVIVGVIALVLALAVGYALFSQTLTINGTAKASAEFDVIFEDVVDANIESDGYTQTSTAADFKIAELLDNSHALSITVDKLNYPGAYVEIPVIIRNNSSVPVQLKEIKETDLTNGANSVTSNTGKISVNSLNITYRGVAATDAPIPAKTALTDPMIIRVEWDPNDETAGEKTAQFKIEMLYEQATGTTTTSSSAGA